MRWDYFTYGPQPSVRYCVHVSHIYTYTWVKSGSREEQRKSQTAKSHITHSLVCSLLYTASVSSLFSTLSDLTQTKTRWLLVIVLNRIVENLGSIYMNALPDLLSRESLLYRTAGPPHNTQSCLGVGGGDGLC